MPGKFFEGLPSIFFCKKVCPASKINFLKIMHKKIDYIQKKTINLICSQKNDYLRGAKQESFFKALKRQGSYKTSRLNPYAG